MSSRFAAIVAEFLGTAVLVATVIGSGMMGAALSSDLGVVLLINAVSTVLVLALLIWLLLPVSGAQFNPLVTAVAVALEPAAERRRALSLLTQLVPAQILGAIAGAALANVMFGAAPLELATTERVSVGTLLGEVVATAGLIAIIFVAVARGQTRLLPVLVASWIGAAYFFTSSTSFANPAVTVGRMFSDSFAGIAPSAVLPFIAAQLIGAVVGVTAAIAINRTTSLTELDPMTSIKETQS